MRQLTSIVAVNAEGVIGAANRLPWRLRSDMRFFREQTTDNVVLMGRKTYDSLGHKCLPERYNVVVSHHFGLLPPSVESTSATGISDALFRASIAPKRYREHFIIGGASMYEQFAPFVDRYLITLVDKQVPDGDTFFDQGFLGNPDEWTVQELFRRPASDFDEASFSTFEILARESGGYRERRNDAIAEARAAATSGAPLRDRPVKRQGSGDETGRMYSMF